MGCACIVKNVEIKTKDINIDLSGEQTKTHKLDSTVNINIFEKEISDDIFQIKKSKFNSSKHKRHLNKLISNSIESKKTNDQVLSGPIITLLKSRVENYHRKMKKM